jgi:hypothetical protein
MTIGNSLEEWVRERNHADNKKELDNRRARFDMYLRQSAKEYGPTALAFMGGLAGIVTACTAPEAKHATTVGSVSIGLIAAGAYYEFTRFFAGVLLGDDMYNTLFWLVDSAKELKAYKRWFKRTGDTKNYYDMRAQQARDNLSNVTGA